MSLLEIETVVEHMVEHMIRKVEGICSWCFKRLVLLTARALGR